MVSNCAYRCLLAGLLVVGSLAIDGCRGLGLSHGSGQGPTINSFTATPTTIVSGSSALLSWTTSDATGVSIDHGVGSFRPIDSTPVSPTTTTTYTLIAHGKNGGDVASTLTVTVMPSSDTPLVQLRADPTTIDLGKFSTLSWTTSNATSIKITPPLGGEVGDGPLPLQGSVAVSPTQTTTYTATATAASGKTASATVTITVNQVPPTINFAANPASILAGDNSALIWSTTNATTFQIDQGVGAQPPNGRFTVHPAVTTTYTATATGPGGTQTAQTTITVAPAGTLAVSITADPLQIATGQSTTLHWHAQNAVNVDVEPEVGPGQPLIGNATVHPAATTTYTATATDITGQHAQATVTVTVVGVGDLSKIKHIIFFVQENRSFDMYFGKLGAYKVSKGLPNDIDGFDPNVSLIGRQNTPVSPFHERTQRTENLSPSWNESHYDIHESPPGSGHFLMDNFLQTTASVPVLYDPNGDRAMGYYDQTDLPVYYELAAQFATSDRWFSPVLSQTIPNRMYLFAGTSFGHIRNEDSPPSDGWPQPTIFDQLDAAGINWRYYYFDANSIYLAQWHTWFKNNGADRGRVWPITELERVLQDPDADNQLPQVVFIERGSTNGLDEHPENNVTIGAGAVVPVIDKLLHSAAWPSSVMMLTYDEGGGLYDHTPPFNEVNPDGINPLFQAGDTQGDNFGLSGFRVPLIVISPWVKPHFVSHVPRDHTAMLRFIETRFNLPALTRRDGAQDNMLEFFDFSSPSWLNPPPLPAQPVCAAGSSPCDDQRLETHP